MTTSIISSSAQAVDNRLLDNRYIIELSTILNSNLGVYEERSARINLDRKYSTVRQALQGLYDLGIQHQCNLSELLANYSVVIGQRV